MENFSALAYRRSSIQGNLQPPGIRLVPRRWADRDFGGPDYAQIEAYPEAEGSEEAVLNLLSWLGETVEIHNAAGTRIWWGHIYEVAVTTGYIVQTVSLESLYNRVAVQYSTRKADGSTESQTTSWVQDDISIARWGLRELLWAMPEGYGQDAVTVRDRLLASFAQPTITTESGRGDGSTSAVLSCKGDWHKGDGIYYHETEGQVQHDEGTNDHRRMGAAYTATTISFGPAALTAIGGGTGGTDDIADTANGFAGIEEQTRIYVAGASVAQNNGSFTVASVLAPNHIETMEKTQANEAAGASVTLSIEHPRMVRFAQRFRHTHTQNWPASKVSVMLQKIGNPTDDVRLRITTDSAGSVGSEIAAVTIPAVNIFTNLQWVDAIFPVAPTLVSGTYYWLLVERMGSASLTDHYLVGVDEDLGYADGTARVDYGTGWQVPSGLADDKDFDLLFRITGQVDTATIIQRALLKLGLSSVILLDGPSGILEDLYHAEYTAVQQYVEELCERGTSDGKRLTGWLDAGGQGYVRKQPANSGANPRLLRTGVVQVAGGAPYEAGKLIAGHWLDVEVAPALEGFGQGANGATYITSSEYDAGKRALGVRSQGSVDPLAIFHFQKR